MLLIAKGLLVMGRVLTKLMSFDQSRFNQQIKGVIDGSPRNMIVSGFHF